MVLDNSKPTSNNDDGYDIDEIQINMADKKPLNDPNCSHPNVVKDTTEELGDAFQCQDCNIGWIVAR